MTFGDKVWWRVIPFIMCFAGAFIITITAPWIFGIALVVVGLAALDESEENIRKRN